MSRDQDACPVCKSKGSVHFITGFDRLFPRSENYPYVMCTQCSLVRICPLPTEDELASFYGKEYGPHGAVDEEEVSRRLERPFNRLLTRYRFHALSRPSGITRYIFGLLSTVGMRDTLTPTGKCRLLDVGCGSGGWLYKHQLLGWEVHGVELVQEACEKARSLGLDVYLGDIFAVPSWTKFDVISFRSVLEHLSNPVETMERASQLVAPGGRVIVMAPNIESWGFCRYGVHWYPLDPPRHLLQLSTKSLATLAERAGLKLLSIKTRASGRWVMYSRINARVFPADILETKDLEIRRAHIEKARRIRETPPRMDRVYRKAVALRGWWEARRARGEMICATFTRK